MVQAETLVKGQRLRVDLNKVRDRLPADLVRHLSDDPIGVLIGYKMVDGNSFGLVLQLTNSMTSWFFENELHLLAE